MPARTLSPPATVNDIFTGSAGNDILDGEFGYDRANYGGTAGPINVQLADGIVSEYDAGLIADRRPTRCGRSNS